MLIESLLRRFVVVGTHAQHSVDATEVACLEFLDNGCGVVATTSHEDRHSPIDCRYHEVLDLLFLILGEAWSLTRCGEYAEEVGSVVKLILHQAHQRLVVNRPVLTEGGDEGYAQSFKYVTYHILI